MGFKLPAPGDLQLQFMLADYIDEWFWLPPT